MFEINKKIYKNEGNSEVISLIKGSKQMILDVGCGVGDNARLLTAKGHIVDGITISETELEMASQELRNGYLFNLENGLPLNLIVNHYNYVICSHVLEHICYPDKLLNDIRRVLKPEGLLIVALPNLMHYKSRLELIKGNFNYQSTGIWDNTHFRWYTLNSGKKLLEENNFDVQLATVTGDVPVKSILKILPERVLIRLYQLFKFISKGLFGYQLLYKAGIKN